MISCESVVSIRPSTSIRVYSTNGNHKDLKLAGGKNFHELFSLNCHLYFTRLSDFFALGSNLRSPEQFLVTSKALSELVQRSVPKLLTAGIWIYWPSRYTRIPSFSSGCRCRYRRTCSASCLSIYPESSSCQTMAPPRMNASSHSLHARGYGSDARTHSRHSRRPTIRAGCRTAQRFA